MNEKKRKKKREEKKKIVQKKPRDREKVCNEFNTTKSWWESVYKYSQMGPIINV
jgi:hypothetical protein